MKRFRKITVLICALISAMTITSFSDQYDTNAKIKALYMYNFAKYIEWPADYKQGDFIIGVIGDSPVLTNLVTMAKVKKVFNQSIKVVKYNSPSEIKKCHMLLVPSNNASILSQCVRQTSDKSTLIVTDKTGLGNASSINFVIVNRKQKFELNKSNVSKQNLTVSSNLLKLAIVI